MKSNRQNIEICSPNRQNIEIYSPHECVPALLQSMGRFSSSELPAYVKLEISSLSNMNSYDHEIINCQKQFTVQYLPVDHTHLKRKGSKMQ